MLDAEVLVAVLLAMSCFWGYRKSRRFGFIIVSCTSSVGRLLLIRIDRRRLGGESLCLMNSIRLLPLLFRLLELLAHLFALVFREDLAQRDERASIVPFSIAR